jgi:hypothetical protein
MTALDPEKVIQLLAAIRGGSDLDTACHFATLPVPLVYRWLERGKIESTRVEMGGDVTPSEAEFVDFWVDLKKARADAITRNVSTIQKAAQSGTWKAAAWWLERTMPDVYGKQATSPAIDSSAAKEITQD